MHARSRQWPDPRVKPPYRAAELDRSHPLAIDLLAAYLLQGTNTAAIDSAGSHTLPAANGNVPYVASAVGLAVQLRTDKFFGLWANQWTHSGRPSAYPLSIYVLSAAATGDNGSNRGAVQLYDSTTAWQFRLGWNGSNGRPLLTVRGDSITAGSEQGVNVWTHLVGIADSATSRSLWVNGLQVATGSSSQSYLTPANLVLSEALAGNPFIDLAVAYIWTRALSSSDVRWVSSEPYAMFRPIIRRRYFVPAVGGTSIPVMMYHYHQMRTP